MKTSDKQKFQTIAGIILCGFLVFEALFCGAGFSFAQETGPDDSRLEEFPKIEEDFFEALVKEVLEQEKIAENGSEIVLQRLRIEGLEGEWEGREIVVEGVETNPAFKKQYEEGDRVLVSRSREINGAEEFSIVDFIRRGALWWLAAIFLIVILAVGRWRGFRAILGLAFSFLVIFRFVIPRILDGADPLSVTLIFSAVIILVSTYLVYGLNKKSTVAIAGTFAGVAIVGILSVIFANLAKLAGFAQEETLFLANFLGESINLKGLMLAGFIIGALGVLDDITISQVSAVEELTKANSDLSRSQIYKRAMKIGVDHVASMVNTLFLAYAGASFPLLLVFFFGQPPFENFNQVINNEIIATEIVRTFVGSIGLAAAVPITTFLAAGVYKKKKQETA